MINFSSEMNKLFISVNLSRFSKHISSSLKDDKYPIKKKILLSLCPMNQIELLNKSLNSKYIENTFKLKNGGNTKYLNFLLEIIKNLK